MIPLPWTGAARADGGSVLLPPAASTTAASVDRVFSLIYWVDLFFFAVIVVAVVAFVLRWRDRGDARPVSKVEGHAAIEITWAAIPALLLVLFFVAGFRAYMDQSVPPADSMVVRVTGRKWSWSYDYPELGVSASDALRVPAGRPVKLVLGSADVIHSFSVPDFRLKKDAVPGRYTVAWFQAPEPGEHVVFCAEYCGAGHSRMLSKVVVMPPEEFEAWVSAERAEHAGERTTVQRGEELVEKMGCLACHSVEGETKVGPPLDGVFGAERPLADGTTVRADEDYLRESIMAPGAKVVAGFAPVMPGYQGQLDEDQVGAIVDYLRSLAH